MVSTLEQQEAFVCKFKPLPTFAPTGITASDLVIGTMGHAAAYVQCSKVGTELEQVASIAAEYHSETKDVFLLYRHKTNPGIVVGTTTESFHPQFANEVASIVDQHVKFNRAIILDTVPALSYIYSQYQENVLVGVTSSYAKQPLPKGRIEPGAVISGLSGGIMMLCEMSKRECYTFLGIMQEYSIDSCSIKIFAPVSQIVDYLVLGPVDSRSKDVIVRINSKLENHLFSQLTTLNLKNI